MRLISAVCCCLLVSMSASADTLYDTGFLDAQQRYPGVVSWTGALSDNEVGLARFTLDTDALLTDLRVWTYDSTDGSSGYLTAMTYGIFADSDLTARLSSGFGAITYSVGIGHSAHVEQGNGYVIETAFTIEPIALTAGAYWLTLLGATDRPQPGPSEIANWAFAANTTGGAFAIDGVSVPEPATLLLLVLGMTAAIVRRK